jgi:hypothetical protein
VVAGAFNVWEDGLLATVGASESGAGKEPSWDFSATENATLFPGSAIGWGWTDVGGHGNSITAATEIPADGHRK